MPKETKYQQQQRQILRSNSEEQDKNKLSRGRALSRLVCMHQFDKCTHVYSRIRYWHMSEGLMHSFDYAHAYSLRLHCTSP